MQKDGKMSLCDLGLSFSAFVLHKSTMMKVINERQIYMCVPTLVILFQRTAGCLMNANLSLLVT